MALQEIFLINWSWSCPLSGVRLRKRKRKFSCLIFPIQSAIRCGFYRSNERDRQKKWAEEPHSERLSEWKSKLKMKRTHWWRYWLSNNHFVIIIDIMMMRWWSFKFSIWYNFSFFFLVKISSFPLPGVIVGAMRFTLILSVLEWGKGSYKTTWTLFGLKFLITVRYS